MKQKLYLFFIIFLVSFTANAVRWPKAKIEITHQNNNTQIYVTSYQDEKKLVLELPFNSDEYDTQLGTDQNRDVVGVTFTDKDEKNFGALFFDLPTGRVSPIFLNTQFVDSEAKKVITLYDAKKNTYTIGPMSESCKKPFIYHDTLKTHGPELYSTFLPNGNLYIKSYAVKNGKDHFFTIPINYKKLYADCRGQKIQPATDKAIN